MGTLHRSLATIELPLPRPLVAAYASLTTLQRRLKVTELAVQNKDSSHDLFAWQNVSLLIEAYEDAADVRLTLEERKALLPYAAAIPLYHAVHDGFKNDPAKSIQQLPTRRSFLRLSEQLLTQAD